MHIPEFAYVLLELRSFNFNPRVDTSNQAINIAPHPQHIQLNNSDHGTNTAEACAPSISCWFWDCDDDKRLYQGAA
jgi:hypothetical protein